MIRAKTVDEYILNSGNSQQALILLRDIIRSTEIEETVKWGAPAYTINGKNVAGMAAFKSYTGIWFFQGALLKDKKKKLINAQDGVTKALRQWRFNSIEEISADAGLIKEYLEEAIGNQKQGKAIKPTKKAPPIVPNELKQLLKSNSNLKNSFESFSESKRREFTDYISEAKRQETKQKRLDKVAPMILDGVGLYDKYRK